MFYAIHHCDCGDPECGAVMLVAHAATEEELLERIKKRWEELNLSDPNFAVFDVIHDVAKKLHISRTQHFSIEKVQ